MKFIQLLQFLLLLTITATASAQYSEWQHSGSIFINTSPNGADLPAAAVVDDFPVLVRLHRDFFDFAAAKPAGEDVRFSTSEGKPLAYQIEKWDAAQGEASVWVRVPQIKGNARQELKLHWGKADAAAESDGKAVFNESNGYLAVLHMGEEMVDAAGSVTPENEGTTGTVGMIGTARHFATGQGIFCGEQNGQFPLGASPHSSEAWFRAEKVNGTVLGWGTEQAQGKVVMQFRSPPHVRMDCYFSGANISSEGQMPISEWVHVCHTYEQGATRIYVNGALSKEHKTADGPLALKSPARFFVGGWYRNYDFLGDIDEVRISKVVRSADWVKLQFENQKPLQSLVGPVVRPGDVFKVSPESATVAEGQSATFNAEAGGAQKIYWVLKDGGREAVVSVDKLAFTFDAGRVTANKQVTLQCRTVYPAGVMTKEIAITVKETIPDPEFTLTAPARWDGRTELELVPDATNFRELMAIRSADLKTRWEVSGGAVIRRIVPGSGIASGDGIGSFANQPSKLILERSQFSGPLTVTATISNGGTPVSRSVTIAVTEPASDPWVARTPAPDEKPVEGQFFAREANGEGTLHYNGALTEAADAVFLKLYADDKLIHTASAAPAADKSYALAVKLKPGLIHYKVEFGTQTDGQEKVLETVGDLVCGDAYIITGQSNALATDTGEKSPPETNEWIRSYGRPQGNEKEDAGNLWCRPVWKAEKGEKAELGWWGMELAKQLLQSQKMPIFIINAAAGGTRIDQHQRSADYPADVSTIYGRMLWRAQQARITHGIRGILWHQGESDQGSDGPTGGYGWEAYQQLFIDMSAGWKQDFPNVQHYYIFQIWPDACSMGGRAGWGDMLREKQRTLPRLYSNMSIMSTLGIVPPGPCHFPLMGWGEIAHLVQPLIERDFYGKAPAKSITPPNLVQAAFAEGSKDSITLEFDQPIKWKEELAGQFYLDSEKGKVVSGSVTGNVLTLKLKEASSATKITYLKGIEWSQMTLLEGTNGIAALTFCNVPLAPITK